MEKFRRATYKLAVCVVSIVPVRMFRYDDTRAGVNANFTLSIGNFL